METIGAEAVSFIRSKCLICSAVNCEWEETCDACSVTCGSGTSTCHPRITVPAAFGGRPCPPAVVNGISRTIPCENLSQCEGIQID